MAKEDYLEGYGQGLETGKQGSVRGAINKTLDMALGNPHESAKRGYEQGYAEMKSAKKAESEKKMAKGGKVSSASKRADGCAVKGKTKGRMI